MAPSNWSTATEAMLTRVAETAASVPEGVPHWAASDTGEWTLTADGDWTGGGWVGQLWLADLVAGSSDHARSLHWLDRMRPRLARKTAFKGFTFYYGAALGQLLFGDDRAADTAREAAKSLADLFDDRLGLIPLGVEAEEHSAVGAAESSIDSLQASSLLLWSADVDGDRRHGELAARHIDRVLANHVRDDGSVIQSTTLDAHTGEVLRSHTHKGYSETSVWGRAQTWAMLYSAMGALRRPDQSAWLEYARRTCDWWIAHIPDDKVAYWDFDDPAIPDTARDTAATAMAAAAMLKLAGRLGDDPAAATYRDFATETAAALVDGYVEVDRDGRRPYGMLHGGCFTRRPDARPQDQDATEDVELVFGSYFLLETLAVLQGLVDAREI